MPATLFVLTAAIAAGDWLAVCKRCSRVEYVLKPLTLVLLIAATASADVPLGKGWLLAGLVFGLAGDIALMTSADVAEQVGSLDAAFLIGLAAFLVGHLCYLTAFTRHGLDGLHLVAGAVVVAGVAGPTMPRILSGARATGGRQLTAIVSSYAAVLAAVAVLAVGTGSVLTAIGGLLFLASDTVIAWERFVRRLPNGPVIVIVTYHLAQLLIVLGLIRH